MMLEKRNSITIAGVFRFRLIDDSVHMPTPAMEEIWGEFQADLNAYEAGLDEALKPYSIIPSQVASSVHA